MILSPTRRILSESLGGVRQDGARLGLVPTMGYLHEGHLSLVDLARERSDFLAVSIFVNPLQFGPGEDLDRYPRDLDRDLALLRDRGADLVFFPSVDEMYPDGEPQVVVDPGPMSERLCGEYRPGHFRGVLTAVARLFGLFRPQVAVFGQKDYQQAVLIRRMVRDLEMGIEISLGPIVREEDGLALSSRNVFLSEEQWADALGLRQSLTAVQKAFQMGIRSGKELRRVLVGELADHPNLHLQYGEIVHPESLESLEAVGPGAVVAVAALCGRTRLIDNHILEI
ncbi:MAG: pantoate--beta-alanine ligase [Gemmatimonadota bacterium]